MIVISSIGNVSVVSCVSVHGVNKVTKEKKNKQFPRWSLVTLWFNESFKRLSAKLIMLSTQDSHIQTHTLERESTNNLSEVVFVCFVHN